MIHHLNNFSNENLLSSELLPCCCPNFSLPVLNPDRLIGMNRNGNVRDNNCEEYRQKCEGLVRARWKQ